MRQRSRFLPHFPSICSALLAISWLLGLGSLPSALGQDSVPDHTRPRPDSFARPVLIEFKGEINEMLASYFNRAMDRAKSAKADLIVVEVDSPGGLKVESLQMARRLRDCNWAYTVVICENEAISGGSLVSLGVDEIHLNPDAKFGDSGEIEFDAERWAWRLIEPKIESYLSRDARDLAESKGRSPDLAEAMVDSDHLVYTKAADDNKNEIEFTSASSDDNLKPDPPWELVIESKTGRFLTVSGKRAVELGLAQGHESSRNAIASELNFDLETLSVYKPTATDYIVDFLNWPLISGLLILIGLTALFLELSAPGISVGGLTAALCALLFFWSHFLGGTAGWLEVTLFISGLLFVAAEIFVIPGFGVAGITGLVLLFASVILASQSFIVPVTAEDWNRTFTSVLVTVTSGCGFLVAAIVITKHMGQLPIFKGFILDARSEDDLDSPDAQKPVSDQPSVSVGDQGIADSFLRPAGRAKFEGRVFDVISDGSFVDAGTPVQVVKVNGNVVTVAEIGVVEQNDQS